MTTQLTADYIEQRIFYIRGEKVMLDSDLAVLYGVTTFNLNKAVKRNFSRFPTDFMFQITPQEGKTLIFQIGISNVIGRGGRRTHPYVFTEQGIAMLSSVLRSDRAISVNVAIMRAFVRLRKFLRSHEELASHLRKLESHLGNHDHQINAIFKTIHRLMNPRRRKPKIGFKIPNRNLRRGKSEVPQTS